MAANDRLIKLTKYVNDMKSKLSDAAPPKHAGKSDNGLAYKNFLKREITMHQKQIDDLKMNEPAKK